MMHLKVGDIVTRSLGGVMMLMRVVKVTDDRIFCNAVNKSFIADSQEDELWQFDRATGVEEDDGLKWGVKYGVTGSFLISDGIKEG